MTLPRGGPPHALSSPPVPVMSPLKERPAMTPPFWLTAAAVAPSAWIEAVPNSDVAGRAAGSAGLHRDAAASAPGCRVVGLDRVADGRDLAGLRLHER